MRSATALSTIIAARSSYKEGAHHQIEIYHCGVVPTSSDSLYSFIRCRCSGWSLGNAYMKSVDGLLGSELTLGMSQQFISYLGFNHTHSSNTIPLYIHTIHNFSNVVLLKSSVLFPNLAYPSSPPSRRRTHCISSLRGCETSNRSPWSLEDVVEAVVVR